MERLTGEALLQCAKEMQGEPMPKVIKECGYWIEKPDGKIQLNRTEFFQAMMGAQGIIVGEQSLPSPKQRRGVVKATTRGVVPLSYLYTNKIGVEAGDYVKITHYQDDYKNQLIIELNEEEAEDTAPAVICPV